MRSLEHSPFGITIPTRMLFKIKTSPLLASDKRMCHRPVYLVILILVLALAYNNGCGETRERCVNFEMLHCRLVMAVDISFESNLTCCRQQAQRGVYWWLLRSDRCRDCAATNVTGINLYFTRSIIIVECIVDNIPYPNKEREAGAQGGTWRRVRISCHQHRRLDSLSHRPVRPWDSF